MAYRGQSMRLSTRLTMAMVALVVLATAAVGVLTYRKTGGVRPAAGIGAA